MIKKNFKRITIISRLKADFWFVVFIFLSFSFLYSLLAITRHDHFQSQGIDFSVYDQALWQYSKFNFAFSTVNNLFDLADRFRLIMLPLSSLYWFTQNERILLLFQSIILSATIFPIWLIAKKYLPKLLAIVIAFLYVDFIGIQATAVYDFHEMSLLPFFLAWLFYFLIEEKWNYYFLFLFLCLSVREHVGFLLSTLGIYIALAKRNAKIAIFTTFISFFWSILAIELIMPALGQRAYSSFVQKGESLENAVLGYLSNPGQILTNFLAPIQKSQTLFWSFLSFGLIPAFYIPLLFTIVFQFMARFLDQLHPVRWTLFFHYSAELTVLMSVSTIYGAKFILGKYRSFRFSLIVLTTFLLASHSIVNVILHSPLKNLLKTQFYKHESWMSDTQMILNKIPKDSSVSAQNNLLPHLSHRKEIYLLPKVSHADYVVMDLHPGQNDWNFYTANLEKTRSFMKQLVTSGSYKIILSSGDVYLLKNNF